MCRVSQFRRLWQSAERYGHDGQALVEFAVILPLLLVIVVGAVDLGRLFYLDVAVSNAAREGVRAASISDKSDGDVRNAARMEVSSAFTITDSDIAIDPSAPRLPGHPVTVTVSYGFAPVTPILSGLMGSPTITVTRSAVAVVQ